MGAQTRRRRRLVILVSFAKRFFSQLSLLQNPIAGITLRLSLLLTLFIT